MLISTVEIVRVYGAMLRFFLCRARAKFERQIGKTEVELRTESRLVKNILQFSEFVCFYAL